MQSTSTKEPKWLTKYRNRVIAKPNPNPTPEQLNTPFQVSEEELLIGQLKAERKCGGWSPRRAHILEELEKGRTVKELGIQTGCGGCC